ncbi:MAG: hypothetical protein RhofKO_26000 [Rhodothermales bacterium]
MNTVEVVSLILGSGVLLEVVRWWIKSREKKSSNYVNRRDKMVEALVQAGVAQAQISTLQMQLAERDRRVVELQRELDDCRRTRLLPPTSPNDRPQA